MHSKIIGGLLLAAATLTGCPSSKDKLAQNEANYQKTNTSATALAAVPGDVSLDGLKETLGLAVRHEFTISTAEGNYTLVRCPFAEGENDLYFLFHERQLVKTLAPESVDGARPKDAAATEQFKKAASQIRFAGTGDAWILRAMVSALAAPGLTHAQVLEFLQPRTPAPDSHPNEIPAPVRDLVLAAGAAEMGDDLRITLDLLRHYDGSAVRIGMAESDVENLYGKPLRVKTTGDGLSVWVYPDPRATGGSQPGGINLAIVFDPSRKVSAVYSDGFFPSGW